MIEAYLPGFMNFKQNNWIKLLLLAEFSYNNTKNAGTSHMLFELNCGYPIWLFYKKNINSYSKLKTVEELSWKLFQFIIVCQENIYHTVKLEKSSNNKYAKRKSYTPGNNVYLNNKYIKTKRNRKLKAKFFCSFRVLHLVES